MENCIKLNDPDYEQGDENTINGTANDDTLVGTTLNDTISGGAGDDLIEGDGNHQIVDGINNSFEFHEDFNQGGGGWGLFEEVDGWKRPDGSPWIELQQSGTVGTASHGNTVLELDSTANATIYRDISGLDPNMHFTLTFDYSPRPGVNKASNGIEVYWDGVLIFSARENGRKLSDFDWTTVTLEVPVTDTDARLEFRGTGRSDSYGMTIDNIQLTGELSDFDPVEQGGDDFLDGGAGDDVILGGSGNDAIVGGEGADQIDGGAGDRDIVSFEGSKAGVTVNLHTGLGSGGEAEGDTYTNVEFVHGSTHNDTLIGDNGTNRLVGHNGDDHLIGGAGNDWLIGGRGADLLDGGAGIDTAEYDWSTSGVTVNLAAGTGEGGYADGDVLQNIENLSGSFYNDRLTGDSGSNRLNGSKGDDRLDGGGGDDILIGGEGADLLIGGSGNRDVADYSEASSAIAVDLAVGGHLGEAEGDRFDGVEYVYGSNFDDLIIGDAGTNRLVGNDGDDRLVGGGGNDIFLGGAGADTIDGGEGNRDALDFRDGTAGIGVDLQTGGFAGEAAGDRYVSIEYVYGSQYDDVIIGETGANRLMGYGGDDRIDGGAGNDYIFGMGGNDQLTGGTGADVFVFKDAFDQDVITDFEAGAGRTDRLWLDLDGIAGMDDLIISDTDDGVIIEVGGYGSVMLEDVEAAQLHPDDFIF